MHFKIYFSLLEKKILTSSISFFILLQKNPLLIWTYQLLISYSDLDFDWDDFKETWEMK